MLFTPIKTRIQEDFRAKKKIVFTCCFNVWLKMSLLFFIWAERKEAGRRQQAHPLFYKTVLSHHFNESDFISASPFLFSVFFFDEIVIFPPLTRIPVAEKSCWINITKAALNRMNQIRTRSRRAKRIFGRCTQFIFRFHLLCFRFSNIFFVVWLDSLLL